jgi:hypothetical protein
MLKRCLILLSSLCLIGCFGGDPAQPRSGDQLVPVVRSSPSWDASQGGLLALNLQLHGNNRAAFAILPGDKLPPQAMITADVQFLDQDGIALGVPVPIVFEPDC